jgi:hypothetical protein
MTRRTAWIGLASVLVLLTTVRGYEISTHRDVVREALRNGSFPFTSEDRDDLIAGAGHEDDDNCLLDQRYRHHGFNPVTGASFDTGLPGEDLNAKNRARRLWAKMLYCWIEGERNGYENTSDLPGCTLHTGGYFHYLGRVSHLLQDMAAPGHVHAPDGHGGWEAIFGYDLEEYWDKSEFTWDGTPGPLTPESPIPETPSWGSRMRPEDWTRMREDILALEATDRIKDYMKVMAFVTYHHSRFYGRLKADSDTPLKENDDPFSRMFAKRIEYDSFFNAWLIDGLGWYEHELRSDAWWPEVDDPGKGEKPDTKVHSDRSADGYFYSFATHKQWDPLGKSGDAWPEAWPNGDDNRSEKETLAQYYGNVLLPWATGMTQGLLAKAWAAKDERIDVLEATWDLSKPMIGAISATVPGLAADLTLTYEADGRISCAGTCTRDGGEACDVAGEVKIRKKAAPWPLEVKAKGLGGAGKLKIQGAYAEAGARIKWKDGDGKVKGAGELAFTALARTPRGMLTLFPFIWEPAEDRFQGTGTIFSECGNSPTEEGEASGKYVKKRDVEVLKFTVECGRQSVTYKGKRPLGSPEGTPFVGTLRYDLAPAKGKIRDFEIDADGFLALLKEI